MPDPENWSKNPIFTNFILTKSNSKNPNFLQQSPPLIPIFDKSKN